MAEQALVNVFGSSTTSILKVPSAASVCSNPDDDTTKFLKKLEEVEGMDATNCSQSDSAVNNKIGLILQKRRDLGKAQSAYCCYVDALTSGNVELLHVLTLEVDFLFTEKRRLFRIRTNNNKAELSIAQARKEMSERRFQGYNENTGEHHDQLFVLA